jgi:hypothetical protein
VRRINKPTNVSPTERNDCSESEVSETRQATRCFTNISTNMFGSRSFVSKADDIVVETGRFLRQQQSARVPSPLATSASEDEFLDKLRFVMR